MRSSPIAVVAGAAVTLAAVASASPDAPLPTSGLAVQTSRGVQLVGLDGRLRRTLAGYRFRASGVTRLGQVELSARDGRAYELRRGRLVRVSASTTALPFGYALRFAHKRWELLRGGKVVQRFPPATHVELDDSGRVLTSLHAGSDGTARATSAAVDLRTGERLALARTCRVGAQRRGVRFELCGYPFDKRTTATIVGVTDSTRRVLAGPAERGSHGPRGWWERVSLSPNGKELLAQWSGECEIPRAYLVDVGTGRLTALGRTRSGSVSEGRALGWSGARALVALPLGACGGSADRLGVYAIQARRGRLVYALPRDLRIDVRLWR